MRDPQLFWLRVYITLLPDLFLLARIIATAMKFLMDIAQAFVCDVRIDLRRGNILMAEKFLHTAEVRAVLEQIGRIGMPQSVRRHFP